MKLLAVTQRVDKVKDRIETRDCLDQRLSEFLLESGYLSIPIPNTFFLKNIDREKSINSIHLWIEKISPDGLIFSGGNDLGSCYERDETEYSLLRYSKHHKLPILGICRGMQIMANFYGIDLMPVKDHVNKRHQLKGEIETEVNSFHDYAISRCPNDFKVIAKSNDEVIKAIRHKSLPWEGWMWHPERENPFNTVHISRLKSLFL